MSKALANIDLSWRNRLTKTSGSAGSSDDHKKGDGKLTTLALGDLGANCKFDDDVWIEAPTEHFKAKKAYDTIKEERGRDLANGFR